MESLTLATHLVALHNLFVAAEKPKARELAKAKFDGAAGAIHALRLAPTPFAVTLAVLEAFNSAGERPGYRPVDNSTQQNYDTLVAHKIVANLGLDA